MRALRWAGASLLVLLAGLLGLVGALLSVTLVLLPLGIPLLFVARKLFRTAGRLVVPRAARHPVEQTQRRAGEAVEDATDLLPGRRSRSARLRRKLHLT
ncbi:hypothetical protein [Nocardioides sp. YIM 152315]|uniref:hypothetical protein n=1 Tax=Nocardioides sp. YIM 152315 TaxID=3031760 RepID=UPI0023DBC4B3|nr:hypothetical protein [Nocardioides sp. YIM 152315]MDF1602523.1 hypothetical protein [Nocardioides sp. YIM 152315]